MANETIFYAGLALMGFAVLAAAIAAPVLILTGSGLRKRLNADYGEKSRKAKRYGQRSRES
jgi:hypothetical protein